MSDLYAQQYSRHPSSPHFQQHDHPYPQHFTPHQLVPHHLDTDPDDLYMLIFGAGLFSVDALLAKRFSATER